ncbi:MAG: hypothetical protein WD795_06965 [Woeseia sp.]
MVKPVKKVRKSAILEHLLDLERQIRSELAGASTERQSVEQSGGRSARSSARDESRMRDSDRTIAPEIAQRYLH